jgi:hypothetical protein
MCANSSFPFMTSGLNVKASKFGVGLAKCHWAWRQRGCRHARLSHNNDTQSQILHVAHMHIQLVVCLFDELDSPLLLVLGHERRLMLLCTPRATMVATSPACLDRLPPRIASQLGLRNHLLKLIKNRGPSHRPRTKLEA